MSDFLRSNPAHWGLAVPKLLLVRSHSRAWLCRAGDSWCWAVGRGLLDAPRTSAGRPVSGPYGKKEQLSAARKPSPLGEGAERSEADEVRRGGSVTRPSRISHIPFSDVRLGGRPNPGSASGESLGRGLPLPPYLRDVPFMWTTLRKKDRLLCPPSTGRSPGKGTAGAPATKPLYLTPEPRPGSS